MFAQSVLCGRTALKRTGAQMPTSNTAARGNEIQDVRAAFVEEYPSLLRFCYLLTGIVNSPKISLKTLLCGWRRGSAATRSGISRRT